MSSARVAPRASAWAVASARSVLRRSRWSRFLTVLGSGTRAKSMARPPEVCRVASPSGSTSTSPPSSRLHQRARPDGSWQSTARAAIPVTAGACSLMSCLLSRSGQATVSSAQTRAQGRSATRVRTTTARSWPRRGRRPVRSATSPAEPRLRTSTVPTPRSRSTWRRVLRLQGREASTRRSRPNGVARGWSGGREGEQEGDPGVELPRPEVPGQLLDQAGPGHGRAGVEQEGARLSAPHWRAGPSDQGGGAGEDGGPAGGGGQGRGPQHGLLELAPVGQQLHLPAGRDQAQGKTGGGLDPDPGDLVAKTEAPGQRRGGGRGGPARGRRPPRRRAGGDPRPAQ